MANILTFNDLVTDGGNDHAGEIAELLHTVANISGDIDGIPFTGGSLTIAGLAYAVANGISQSVRDSHAGWAKGTAGPKAEILGKTGQARDTAYQDWCAFAGVDVDQVPDADEDWAAFIKACIKARRLERLGEVYAGEVGTRTGGPRRSADETLRDTIAEEFLLAQFKSPESKVAWKALDRKAQRAKIAAYAALPRPAAAIAAEFDRRKAAAVALAAEADDTIDLASL